MQNCCSSSPPPASAAVPTGPNAWWLEASTKGPLTMAYGLPPFHLLCFVHSTCSHSCPAPSPPRSHLARCPRHQGAVLYHCTGLLQSQTPPRRQGAVAAPPSTNAGLRHAAKELLLYCPPPTPDSAVPPRSCRGSSRASTLLDPASDCPAAADPVGRRPLPRRFVSFSRFPISLSVSLSCSLTLAGCRCQGVGALSLLSLISTGGRLSPSTSHLRPQLPPGTPDPATSTLAAAGSGAPTPRTTEFPSPSHG